MKSIFSLFVLCIISFHTSYAQPDIDIKAIDSIVSFYETNYQFNGTIAVYKGNETILKKGYGYSNYEFDIKTDSNTIYNIRSLTKGFTDVIIADLIFNGKLDPDDAVSKHLPEIKKEVGDKINIKHLLTHQSGLKPIEMKIEERLSKIDYLKQLDHSDFMFEPGSSESYHDFNYFILGVIIERIEGKDLGKIYDQKIFTPLKMNNSSLSNGESMVKNLAIPYYINQADHSNKLHHVFPRVTEVGYSFGGILSTIDDLQKWLQASHSDKFNRTKVKGFTDNPSFSKDTPFKNKPNSVNFNGQEKKVFVGDGGGAGFRSLYYYFPKNDIYIIMLCNTYYFKPRGAKGGLKYDGIPYYISENIFTNKISFPKIPLSKIMIDNIKNKVPIDSILMEYEDLKKDEENYLVNVKQLNKVAYYCLDQNKWQEAYKLFTLNAKEYPNNWIVYDGLGEYYFRLGNRKETVKYFEKSIELNPNQWREERKLYDKRRNMLEIIRISN